MTIKKNDFKIAKVHPAFLEKIREVALKRAATGIDKRITKEQQSVKRYTKAMTRFQPLWQILSEAEFMEDRNGK